MAINFLAGWLGFALFITVFSGRADIIESGDCTIWTDQDYNWPPESLLLGVSTGGATLTVNGGSIFSTLPWGFGEVTLAGIGLGVNPNNGDSTTAGNSVFISGPGSQIISGIGIGGSGQLAGNQLVISGGGGLTGGFNLGGINSPVLVTDPGSYIGSAPGYLSVAEINGNGDTFTVENGAQVTMDVRLDGTNEVVTISGTNTLWSQGGWEFAGMSNSVTLNQGAQAEMDGDNSVYTSGGAHNSILVGGSGTLLSCLEISLNATNDTFTLSGGAVANVNPTGYPGYAFRLVGPGATATVTDPGTLLTVGLPGSSLNYPLALVGQSEIGGVPNTMVISNGAQVVVWGGNVGVGLTEFLNPQGETLTVTGAGSTLLAPGNELSVGPTLYTPDVAGTLPANNQMIVGAGAMVAAAVVNIQAQSSAIVSGSLYATNATASGQLTLGGVLNLSGLVVADSVVFQSLAASFGGFNPYTAPGSPMVFSSGMLITKGLTGFTGQPMVVGDGIHAASYVMAGGNHAFANGLVISSNSVLTGCGVLCGSVTNYGTIIITNGCDMEFSGPVVNYGTILALNGAAEFQSSFSNYGSLVQNFNIARLTFSGNNVQVQFNTVSNCAEDLQFSSDLSSGSWTTLTNGVTGTGNPTAVTDFGVLTNSQRFYRLLLHY